jgi:colicin import membrane protein
MTRLQKKCLVFSLSLHGLLTVILFASAGFSSSPPPQDLQIMTLIPANIVDRAGAGGGTPVVNLVAQPKAQSQPQPQPQPQAAPAPQPVKTEPVREKMEHAQVPVPTPAQHKETVRPLPVPDETKDVTMESKPKQSKPPRHEIHVSYTLANASTTSRKRPEKSSQTETASSSHSEARRLKEIENSLNELASGVRSSGSPNTIVDVDGIGGGASFAGYKDAVASYYYRAWSTPEDASRQLSADAKVVVARDGSVISAELIRSSGDQTLDKSVERALRAVTRLPPFPASTQDQQRTFVIRFSPLEAKEMTG